MNTYRKSRPLALLTALLTAALILSASIAVPILCRPFYYAQIEPMGLTQTGLSRAEIVDAYDQMMDYCIGLRDDFSAGVLPFSQSGADHFADVRVLFLLDLRVLAVSGVGLALVFLFCRLRRVRPALLLGHGAGFWAACGLGACFLVIGALAALDFQRAFVLFHTIFFPGKTNWLFDWHTDPIILLLPEGFFARCALLILVLLVFWCAILIAADLLAIRRRKKNTPPPACPGCCPGGA